MASTLTQHEAFLQAISEEPHDDAVRLIYADWLEEQNDPRGEFIRIQVALASSATPYSHRGALQEREQELLREHWNAWLSPIREALGPNGEPWLYSPTYHPEGGRHFRRGFIDTYTLPLSIYIQRIPYLQRVSPIQHLFVIRLDGLLPQFARTSAIAELETLHFAATSATSSASKGSQLWRTPNTFAV